MLFILCLNHKTGWIEHKIKKEISSIHKKHKIPTAILWIFKKGIRLLHFFPSVLCANRKHKENVHILLSSLNLFSYREKITWKICFFRKKKLNKRKKRTKSNSTAKMKEENYNISYVLFSCLVKKSTWSTLIRSRAIIAMLWFSLSIFKFDFFRWKNLQNFLIERGSSAFWWKHFFDVIVTFDSFRFNLN